MGITMQQILNARLREYLRAEEMVLRGQAYSIAGRTLTRANLSEIRQAIDKLIADGAYIDEPPDKPDRIRRVVFVD